MMEKANAEKAMDAVDVTMFDLSKKKKKKKKVTTTPVENEDSSSLTSDTQAAMYPYLTLLQRIMTKLQTNNPELGERKRHTMKPPQLMRVGTKKTLWVNFAEICHLMSRPAEHVLAFTLAELGTEGSIDGNSRLVIRGKYVPKVIESLLRKYITEYVTCMMCRSPNTSLTRDSVSRLFFVHCKDCGSSRSVAAIRSGFHAATRADRRAARK